MPPRSEKALLFDIDGTLADTDSLHLEAFNLILGPRGHVIDHERFRTSVLGTSRTNWDGLAMSVDWGLESRRLARDGKLNDRSVIIGARNRPRS
jgi:beta-phosphoglucomutase-like phosphatase (HAD superfamily)